MERKSPFKFDLAGCPPQVVAKGGTIQEANQGTFRADLYFRLAVARIHIPPLRERQEDIEALVEHFAREITGAPGSPFSDATMEALRNHRWSGNVRELRNVVERAVLLSTPMESMGLQRLPVPLQRLLRAPPSNSGTLRASNAIT